MSRHSIALLLFIATLAPAQQSPQKPAQKSDEKKPEAPKPPLLELPIQGQFRSMTRDQYDAVITLKGGGEVRADFIPLSDYDAVLRYERSQPVEPARIQLVRKGGATPTTPSISVDLSILPTYTALYIDDAISKTICAKGCEAKGLTVELLETNGVETRQARVVSSGNNALTIEYNAARDANPAYARIANAEGVALTVRNAKLAGAGQLFTVRGAFGRILRSPNKGPDIDCLDDNTLGKVQAFLIAGTVAHEVRLLGLCQQQAVLRRIASDPITPTTVQLRNTETGELVVAPYQQATELTEHAATFFADPDGQQPTIPDACQGGNKIFVTLIPPFAVSSTSVAAISPFSATVEYVAPLGYQPKGLELVCGARRILLRPLPGGDPIRSNPNVSFSIVDPETLKLNFGKRISELYIVADLQIRNPTAKKIQVKKSAIWFEADYRKVAKSGSLDVTRINTPCDALRIAQVSKGESPALLEHSTRHVFAHHPHDFLSILGSFDSSTDRLQQTTKVADALVAVAAGLAGGIVSGEGYSRAVNLVSGIGLPRFKSIYLNENEVKLRRTRLLAQSFQDIVQIASSSSEQVKIFLPRYPLCNLFPEPVEIAALREVHLELEVVSEVVDESIAKGEVRIGMSKDQVTLALGYHDGTQMEGERLRWTYSSGRVKFVEFNSEGKAVLWEVRSLAEQLKSQEGKADVSEVKRLLGLQYDPQNAYELADGGFIWVSPGPLNTTVRFNKEKKLQSVDYKTAFERVKEFKGRSRVELETELQRAALPEAIAILQTSIAKSALTPAILSVTYPSPDLIGGSITVGYLPVGTAGATQLVGTAPVEKRPVLPPVVR